MSKIFKDKEENWLSTLKTKLILTIPHFKNNMLIFAISLLLPKIITKRMEST
jgi:hypothetical protein